MRDRIGAGFWCGDLREIDHMEELDTDGYKKWNFKTMDVKAWSG
jgi:hypothetical protein